MFNISPLHWQFYQFFSIDGINNKGNKYSQKHFATKVKKHINQVVPRFLLLLIAHLSLLSVGVYIDLKIAVSHLSHKNTNNNEL